jgi:hypothetical protein
MVIQMDLSHVLWAAIHGVACRYESGDRHVSDGVVEFYKSIGHVVGCKTCQKHYYTFLEENPIPRDGGLFTWTVKLHNTVNEKLGKPIVSDSEAENIWFNTNATNSRGPG